LQHQADVALATGAIATLINFTILSLLMISMFRVLRSRQETAALLRGASDNLTKSIAEVELRNRQMEVSAEMLQALDSMASLEETSKIVATYCGKLLPNLPGALFLYRNSRDMLEAQATWGSLRLPVENMEPRDCWALQRGRAHYTSGIDDLCCNHYAHNESEPSGHLCLPLVTQGEVIGLLYFESLSTQELISKSQQQLIDRIGEQIALALSNVRLRETLRRQSIVDPLTGLFNRRYMDETFKRELLRAERKNVPLALIMLDLDHFKRVNDTFGHDAGDAILKNVAQAIRANIRESDLACRFGGEELAIILPECDAETAIERAEKIRVAIASIDVQHGGRPLGSATASLGVAVFPKHGRDSEALLHAADQALYQAKQAGRNRVLVPAD
jgi:diguanylate cyclase (GGDEF)-like protein